MFPLYQTHVTWCPLCGQTTTRWQKVTISDKKTVYRPLQSHLTRKFNAQATPKLGLAGSDQEGRTPRPPRTRARRFFIGKEINKQEKYTSASRLSFHRNHSLCHLARLSGTGGPFALINHTSGEKSSTFPSTQLHLVIIENLLHFHPSWCDTDPSANGVPPQDSSRLHEITTLRAQGLFTVLAKSPASISLGILQRHNRTLLSRSSCRA